MNALPKHALACTVLLNVCGAVSAQSAVTIYGRADAGVDSLHSGGSQCQSAGVRRKRREQPGFPRY